MADIIQALECIGCGKLEGPRPCIGICQDRIVDLVYASEYKQAVARAELLQEQGKAFERLAKQLAWTTPRNGEWERSFRTLQEQARRVLSSAPRATAGAVTQAAPETSSPHEPERPDAA